jgi:RNA polymerase sigma factor (sigma-70 family)
MTSPELQAEFQEQIERHQKILYKVCNLYCWDAGDRQDLAQEILVELWRSFPRFDRQRVFSTWMYRVGINTAISFSRREFSRKRHVLALGDQILSEIPVTEADNTDTATLRAVIDEFDPLNKALLLLYLDGNSYAEISEVLGISATNVGTKIGRLKEALKLRFEKEAAV